MENFIEKNPIKEIKEECSSDLIQETKQHLEAIKSSLKDFIQCIIYEQPDVLIFMDRGARIFGTPIKEYLKTLDMPKIPEVRYYNDDDLKEAYIKNLNIQEIIESDLGDLRGKKVFFLDETYFSGKGAAALKKAKDYLGNDSIFYFALSIVPSNEKAKKEEIDEWNKYYDLPIEEHEKIIQKIKNDKNFVIYDNQISQLFSRLAAKLYTDQIKSNGRTTTVHSGSRRSDRLSGKKTEKEEKDIFIRKNLKSIAIIKKMILDTLIKFF
jgi:hypoxanthine phosphoribosyltransferase